MAAEKRTATISVRVTPNVKRELELQAERERAKSTGEYIHTLIKEALEARAASKVAAAHEAHSTEAHGNESILQALKQSSELVASLVDRQDMERAGVANELQNLRAAISTALVNILVQIGGADPEKAKTAVLAAMPLMKAAR